MVIIANVLLFLCTVFLILSPWEIAIMAKCSFPHSCRKILLKYPRGYMDKRWGSIRTIRKWNRRRWITSLESDSRSGSGNCPWLFIYHDLVFRVFLRWGPQEISKDRHIYYFLAMRLRQQLAPSFLPWPRFWPRLEASKVLASKGRKAKTEK